MQKFKDLAYKRPDKDEVAKVLLSCIDRFVGAESFEDAKDAFLQWQKDTSKM